MVRGCRNCRWDGELIQEIPCNECSMSYSKWEPNLMVGKNLSTLSQNARFNWSDLMDAFACGIKEGQQHPHVNDDVIERACDCYVKKVQLQKFSKDGSKGEI